jgi:hypothetical protein
MSKRLKIITISFIVAMFLTTSFGSLAQHPGGGTPSGETETMTFEGYVGVGETWEETAEFTTGSISKVEFALAWSDDEGEDSDPDTLSLFTTDGMHEPKSEAGSSGIVMITWEEDMLNDTWSMAVTCESAGSTQVPVGPIGLITQDESDPGNSFTLMVTFTYSEGMGGGGPPQRVQDLLNSPIFKTHIALMVASVFLFLGAGFISFAYLSRWTWGKRVSEKSSITKFVINPKPLVFIIILTWIIFFIAAVPLGMYVAGEYYGWHLAWSGVPTMWNPQAWEMTNADNVSLVALVLWAIPMYLNRAWVLKGKKFEKLFGRISFAMKRAAQAPAPVLSYREFTLSYFFLGILIFVIFEVQPHGGGS